MSVSAYGTGSTPALSSASDVADTEPTAPRSSGVALLVVAACAATGVVVAAISFRLARESTSLNGARGLLWLSLALMFAPALARMLSRGPSREERAAILVVAGVAMYLLKVLYDPTRLGFPDELIHATNASRLIADGHLYAANSISPVSANFPGLSSLAAGIAHLFHLGVVPSALLVIGVARVVLTLALFLLFEQVARDARLAGVATLLFCANPNYLYWSSQFSYESLSFPLFVLALFCVLRRWDAPEANRALWTFAALPPIALITITHHVTGLALAAVLWVLVAVALRRGQRGAAPVALALVTTIVVGLWLAFVAPDTFGYLGDIFRRALSSVTDAFGAGGSTHKPFEGKGGDAAPLDDKLLAALSAVLAVVASAAGVRATRKSTWGSPMAPLLMLAAVASIVVYGARVFPDAWETANRASEYVYLGVALMAAVVAVRLADRRSWLLRALPLLAALLAVAGSSVSGWPASAQLPRPFGVDAFGTHVFPQGETAARWAAANEAVDTRYVSNDSTGRLLMVHGAVHVISSRHPGVPELLKESTLPAWQQDFLRRERVDRVVLDDRRYVNDNVIGYYFARPGQTITRYPPGVRRKFERLAGVSKVYDSGDTVVYDIRQWRTAKGAR
ncbi:MAG: hypothetical protein JWR63_406 [Conexibacter sp.]|nr:hypothetical protein [Conexibacter sp.]